MDDDNLGKTHPTSVWKMDLCGWVWKEEKVRKKDSTYIKDIVELINKLETAKNKIEWLKIECQS